MQSLVQETKFILDKYHIKANKSLGQNFLISEEAVNGIVDASEVCSDDLVIEIGPGLGTLTKRLLDRAGKVICIELDHRMVNILQERFALYNNVSIIEDDVLNLDLNKYIREEKQAGIKKAKVVANLPYYITTPIVMKLLEDNLDIESITIMIQKEVADRLLAKPGDSLSGSISYSISYYTKPEFVLDVDRNSFIPAPEVDSTVIKLNVLDKPSIEVENKELFFKLIKFAFMQRRKTLVNTLYNGKIMESKELIEKMLDDLGIDKKIRGEKLSLEDFARMTNYIVVNHC